MKYLALPAALLLSSGAHAQTFAFTLNQNALAALKQANASSLPANIKTGYAQEIDAVMNGLHCPPVSSGWNCEGVEPAGIEKAGNALTAIQTRLTAEIAQGKNDTTIYQRMEPQLLKAVARIKASKVAAGDEARLLAFAAGAENNLKTMGTKETPEQAQMMIDNLNAQISDVIAISQSGQTALASYNEKYAAWTAKIAKANLSTQNKNYYSALTSMAVGSGVTTPCGAGVPPCLNVPKAEAALTQFEALAASMDATVKRMGAQTFVAYYGPKLAAIDAKIESAPIDAPTKGGMHGVIASLRARYADAHIALSPEDADSTYQKVSDGITGDIEKAVDQAKVSADLPKSIAVINAEIANPKLSAQVKASFTAQLNAILSQAHCGATGQCDKPRTPFEAPMYAVSQQRAIAQLAQLDAAIDQAVKAASGPSLAAVYMPKLAKVQNKLATSKVDPTDKIRLMNFIGSFERGLNGLAGPIPTADAAENFLQKISDDVDAAIDMANSKK